MSTKNLIRNANADHRYRAAMRWVRDEQSRLNCKDSTFTLEARAVEHARQGHHALAAALYWVASERAIGLARTALLMRRSRECKLALNAEESDAGAKGAKVAA